MPYDSSFVIALLWRGPCHTPDGQDHAPKLLAAARRDVITKATRALWAPRIHMIESQGQSLGCVLLKMMRWISPSRIASLTHTVVWMSYTFCCQHRYMWYSTGGNTDVRVNETETWDEIPGLTLNVVLPEPACIRIMYCISVMPDQNFASDGETWATRCWPDPLKICRPQYSIDKVSQALATCHVVDNVAVPDMDEERTPRHARLEFLTIYVSPVHLDPLRLSASRAAEDVSARLVVDGVPYRESIGSYALLSRHMSSGMLERDLVLDLQVRTRVLIYNTLRA